MFTNNGDLARKLEHPENKVMRTYQALVRGELLDWKFDLLKRGVTVQNVRYRPIQAVVETTKGKDTWLRVQLHEGKVRLLHDVVSWSAVHAWNRIEKSATL